MNNLWIKISTALFLILNLVMILSGLILMGGNRSKIEDEIFNTLTSKSFIDYATNGYTNDVEVMTSEYFEPSINSETGKDESILNRDEFSASVYSNEISWDDFMKNIRLFVGSGGFFPEYAVNPYGASIIVTLDKGGEVWGFILSGLLELLGVDNFIINSGAQALADTILNPLTKDGFLEKMNIDLLTFDETFENVYIDSDGNEKTEIYNFSDGIQENEITGDEDLIGLENWNSKMTKNFFSTVYINIDFKMNNHSGNLIRSLDSHVGLGQGNEAFVIHTFAQEYLEKIEIDSSKNRYDYISFKENQLTTNLIITENITIDSEGEAMYYAIYENIDYKKYFDNALINDGLDSYSISTASKWRYSNSKSFINTTTLEDEVWTLETESVDFGTFMFIVKEYSPFLRDVNYTKFIRDFSKMVTKDFELSTLPIK